MVLSETGFCFQSLTANCPQIHNLRVNGLSYLGTVTTRWGIAQRGRPWQIMMYWWRYAAGISAFLLGMSAMPKKIGVRSMIPVR